MQSTTYNSQILEMAIFGNLSPVVVEGRTEVLTEASVKLKTVTDWMKKKKESAKSQYNKQVASLRKQIDKMRAKVKKVDTPKEKSALKKQIDKLNKKIKELRVWLTKQYGQISDKAKKMKKQVVDAISKSKKAKAVAVVGGGLAVGLLAGKYVKPHVKKALSKIPGAKRKKKK
jgi:peptidoglycan hydrolase CwlO-like protein